MVHSGLEENRFFHKSSPLRYTGATFRYGDNDPSATTYSGVILGNDSGAFSIAKLQANTSHELGHALDTILGNVTSSTWTILIWLVHHHAIHVLTQGP